MSGDETPEEGDREFRQSRAFLNEDPITLARMEALGGPS